MVAQPIVDIDGRRAQLARDNLIVFTRRMFPEYKAANHHWRIAYALQDIATRRTDRLLIIMPPGHGKSTLASEHFPAWYLGNFPDHRVIACSHTTMLAYTFSRRARGLFASPAWPFAVETAGDWSTVQSWTIHGHRGGYFAVGIGSGVTGIRTNLLVIDDPVKSSEEAASEVYRERTWEWFSRDALTRLDPGGAVVMIGTRWHEDDLIGRVLAAPDAGRWSVLHMPALADDGSALWPEQFSAADLMQKREGMGSRPFEAIYQGRPSPVEGAILKRQWWRFWSYPGQPLPPVPVGLDNSEIHLAPCVELPPFWDEQIQSWDMAFKDTATSDYVAGQVWGRWRADRYLLDQTLGRLDFPATVAAVRELSERWPTARRKLVEDKANGSAVIAFLKRDIAGLIPINPEGGKVVRAHAVTAQIESGNVYLPHPRIAPWVDAFLTEATSFPNAKYDDQVDATTQALIAMEAGAGSETVALSYMDGPEEDEDVRRW